MPPRDGGSTGTDFETGWLSPGEKVLQHLRDEQAAAVTAVLRSEHLSPILEMPTGAGKCLGPSVPVLRADGLVVRADEVRAGDLLMGPDGLPRTVLGTTRGYGPMLEVVPKRGMRWTCNDAHVLTLQRVRERAEPRCTKDGGGDLVDMPVLDFLQGTKHLRHIHKQLRVPVEEFHPASHVCFGGLPIPPYILGLLLGDGSITRDVGLTTAGAEIEREFAQWVGAVDGMRVRRAERHDSAMLWAAQEKRAGMSHWSPVAEALRGLGLMGKGSADKFIPYAYRVASRADRLEMLAGLIDTDGSLSRSGFDYITKSPALARDVAFIARSVGLAVTERVKWVPYKGQRRPYHRLSITGETQMVPCRLPRKQAAPRMQKKNPLRTGITVRPIGDGPYAGFQVDGDGRFLLGDFTVTHNSWVIAALAQEFMRSGIVLMATHRDTLVRQNRGVLIRKAGITPTFYGAGLGKRAWSKVTYGNVATLANVARRTPHLLPKVAAVIVDECHRVPVSGGGQYRTLLTALRERSPECRLIGLSATPFRGNGASLCDEEGALFDEVVHRVPIRWLIEQGRLVPPVPYAARNELDVSKLKVRAGEFRDEEQVAQIDPAIPAIADEMVEAADRHGRRATVSMLPRVAQSEALAAALRARGQTAVSVTMDTPGREAILQDFREGRIRHLTSVSVLVEGFDATRCDMVCLIVATRSPIKYIQSIGRGLRPHEGKRDCLVLDFGGNTERQGPIDDVRMPTPGKAGDPQMKACRACGALNRPVARVCEQCGAPFGGGETSAPELGTRSNTGRLLSDGPVAAPAGPPPVGTRETFTPTSVDVTRISANPMRGTPAWCIVHFKGEDGISADLKLFPDHDKGRLYFLPKLMRAFGEGVVSAVAPCRDPEIDTTEGWDKISWLQRHVPNFPLPARVTRVRTEFNGRKSWEAKAFRRGCAAPPPPTPAYEPFRSPPPNGGAQLDAEIPF